MFDILPSKDFIWDRDVPQWLYDNYQFFTVPSLLYVVIVYYVQGRVRINVRPLMFVWNLTLALYSGVSFIAIAPHHIRRIYNYGYYESVCMSRREESFFMKPYGWWIYLFILSKIVEFGDTLFILLSGKEVQFLHWYHHLSVVFAMYVQSMRGSTLIEWITVINLAIHTWMYTHYAFATITKKIRGNRILTYCQILQMIHSLFAALYHAKYCNNGLDVSSMTLSFIYAFIFVEFYIRKYNSRKIHNE